MRRRKNLEIVNTLKSKIYKLKTSESGQSLLEIVVGLGIGALLIGTAAFVIAAVLKANTGIQRSQTAGTLSQELMDQMRTFGNADWQNIYNLDKGSDNLHFLNASGSVFAAQKGEDGTIDNDIRNGLIGYWKFNEGAGISTLDAAGQGLHGMISIGGSGTQTTSSEAWSNGTSGKVGKAISLDGTDDYIQVTHDSSLNFAAGSFSMMGWIKSSDTGNYKTIISKMESIASWQDAGFRLYAFGGKLALTIADGTNVVGDGGSFKSSASVTMGDWTHVVLVIDRSSQLAVFYINGFSDNSTSISSIGNINNNGSVDIGKLSALSGWYYTGLLDDMRMYNRALSADEIKRLYNSNVFIRSFYVENTCRSNDSSSTISGVAPCVGGTADDPLTQKITVSTAWTVGSNTNSVTLADYLTRWKNAIFWQSDWSGGEDDSGVYTESGKTYASSTNIQITTSGSVRIIDL